MPAKTEGDMLFKSKAREKATTAAANADDVMGGMVQQQHSVVEQVAATPLVPKAETASCIGSGMEVEVLNSMKSGAPEKDKNAAANAAEVMGGTMQPHAQARARAEPTTKAGTASCIGSDMSIVGNIECK